MDNGIKQKLSELNNQDIISKQISGIDIIDYIRYSRIDGRDD